MINHYAFYSLAEDRVRSYQAEAQHDRMVQEAKNSRLNWYNRIQKPSEREQVEISTRAWIEAGNNAGLRSI